MKVTLDTNVLLSATFWEGASFRILKLAEEGKINIILSEQIMQEYANALFYEDIKEKIRNKNLETKITIENLVNICKIVIPSREISAIKEDTDDNIILECAVEGNVNYIITNDNHLLKLKEFEGIKIVTPEVFLKIFYN